MKEINLDSIAFNSLITREDILKSVTQEDVFSFYLGEDISSLGVYHSPLREDNIPSFALYFHRINRNVLMFKDFATGACGDFVVLVMKMFDLSYGEAMKKIAFDMGLSQFDVVANKQIANYTRIIERNRVELGVKFRPWMTRDKVYWLSFGIKKSTLEKFNVRPIDYIFYNESGVKAHQYAYAYIEYKDNRVSYKIYQPLETRIKKWINNADSTVHQGYTQLPKSGDLLIITKSLKDVMSIHDCLNISAIGLQSESIMMKDSVMDEYKQRFKRVICLFDNDEPGEALAIKFVEKYNIPYISIPKMPKVTDFSDLVKAVGIQEASTTVEKLIKNL